MSTAIDLDSMSVISGVKEPGVETVSAGRENENPQPAPSTPAARAEAVKQVSGPRNTRSSLVFKVTLLTDTAFNTLRYNFSRANDALASVSLVLPRIGTEEECNEMNRLIEDVFAKRERELDTTIANVRKLLSTKSGLDGANYTQSHVVEVTANTPRSIRFIQLVKKLDELCTVIDACWMMEIITEKERYEYLYRWEKRLSELSRTIFRKQQGLVRAIRERRNAAGNAQQTPVGDGAANAVSAEKAAGGETPEKPAPQEAEVREDAPVKEAPETEKPEKPALEEAAPTLEAKEG